MIQQGVSLNQAESLRNGEGGMTIGWVMDWLEAQLEAIKLAKKEEDGDREHKKEKDEERNHALVTTSTSSGPSKPDAKLRKASMSNLPNPSSREHVRFS